MHEKTDINDTDARISNITCIHKSDFKLNLQNKENLILNVSNRFAKMRVNEIMMTEKNTALLDFYFQLKHCKRMKENAMKKQYNNIHVKNLLLLINKNSKRHFDMIEPLISKIYKKKTERMLPMNTDESTKEKPGESVDWYDRM